MRFFVTWVIECWGQGNKKHVQQIHKIYECRPEDLSGELKKFIDGEGKNILNSIRNAPPAREIQTFVIYHQPITVLPNNP